jgi:hypothetical protein
VAVLAGDFQHLVHEREVGNARCNGPCRLGRLVLLLLDQLLPAHFVGGFILGLGTAVDERFRGGLRPGGVGAKEPFAVDLQGLRERGD